MAAHQLHGHEWTPVREEPPRSGTGGMPVMRSCPGMRASRKTGRRPPREAAYRSSTLSRNISVQCRGSRGGIDTPIPPAPITLRNNIVESTPKKRTVLPDLRPESCVGEERGPVRVTAGAGIDYCPGNGRGRGLHKRAVRTVRFARVRQAVLLRLGNVTRTGRVLNPRMPPQIATPPIGSYNDGSRRSGDMAELHAAYATPEDRGEQVVV